MIFNGLGLQKEEEAVFLLRSLYEKYGFSQYKMNKFEEYDLYVQNKDFLISDGIITFTDTNGKLMALKPDVTLSIVKNSSEEADCVEKVYYDENVYRVSGGTNSFKEIRQVGIECIGAVDSYQIFEVLCLAAKSLNMLSEDFVLDVSDFGILSELAEAFGLDYSLRNKLFSLIGEKNLHELISICKKVELEDEKINAITSLISIYGDPKTALPKLRNALGKFVSEERFLRLETLFAGLSKLGFGKKMNLDFSVVSDTDYYNGIVFRGFIKKIPTRVLSGGQYDRLLEKMEKKAKAIGFAVYLDLLSGLSANEKRFDVDAVMIYDDTVSEDTISSSVNEMIIRGKRVVAQKKVPEKLRYFELYKITESGVELLERNA